MTAKESSPHSRLLPSLSAFWSLRGAAVFCLDLLPCWVSLGPRHAWTGASKQKERAEKSLCLEAHLQVSRIASHNEKVTKARDLLPQKENRACDTAPERARGLLLARVAM